MKIRAAVLRQKSGPFLIEELDLAAPEADEIRVKIAAVGMCHTDLIVRDQFYPTPLPVVLGHEGAGVVDSVGPGVRAIAPGDHVLLSFGSCGQCRSCTDGDPAYCWDHMGVNFSANRVLRGGHVAPSALSRASGLSCEAVGGSFFSQSSFATYAMATERNAVVIGADEPLDVLAPLGCGFQTGAGAVLNTLRPRPGSAIAIFGAGSVGQAAIMAAVIAGCDPIIAVDLVPARLDMAQRSGATHVLGAGAGDVVGGIKNICRAGVGFSIETTANPHMFRAAVDVLQPRGVCGLIGGARVGTEASFEMTHILFGRTIRGILQGDSHPKSFLPELIALRNAGRFPIDNLIRRYAFDEINQAAADMKAGVTFKPVFVM